MAGSSHLPQALLPPPSRTHVSSGRGHAGREGQRHKRGREQTLKGPVVRAVRLVGRGVRDGVVNGALDDGWGQRSAQAGLARPQWSHSRPPARYLKPPVSSGEMALSRAARDACTATARAGVSGLERWGAAMAWERNTPRAIGRRGWPPPPSRVGRTGVERAHAEAGTQGRDGAEERHGVRWVSGGCGAADSEQRQLLGRSHCAVAPGGEGRGRRWLVGICRSGYAGQLTGGYCADSGGAGDGNGGTRG